MSLGALIGLLGGRAAVPNSSRPSLAPEPPSARQMTGQQRRQFYRRSWHLLLLLVDLLAPAPVFARRGPTPGASRPSTPDVKVVAQRRPERANGDRTFIAAV